MKRIKLIIQISYLEILVFFAELYRSREDLIQIFYRGNFSPNGVASLFILFLLIVLLIKHIKKEIVEELFDLFERLRKSTFIGSVFAGAAIPIHVIDYEQHKKIILNKMLEHNVVRMWFGNNIPELEKYIEKKYREYFILTGQYPIGYEL